MKLNKVLRSRFFIICLLAMGFLIYVHSGAVRLPSDIVISVGEGTTTTSLKIYYNIGNGWNEQQSIYKVLPDSPGIVNFPLPLNQITHYRIDMQAGQSVVLIERLCFESAWAEKCWQSHELEKQFIPLNGIVRSGLRGRHLEVVSQGNDPFFAFMSNDASNHDAVARPSWLLLIPFAFALATLIYFGFQFFRKHMLPRVVKQYDESKSQGFAMYPGQAGMLVAVISMVICLSWAGLYDLGSGFYLLLIAMVILVVSIKSQESFVFSSYSGKMISKLKDHHPGWKEVVLIFLLVLLPVVYLLTATWNQEFPNIGDHEYHWSGNKFSYDFIKSNMGFLLLLLAGLALAVLLGKVGWFCVFAVVVLIIASRVNDIHEILYRYPAGSRFLASSFVYLAQNGEIPTLNAGRLANATSIALYLMVLRPLIIGRWPNLLLLPFALAFFFQGEVVYYFTTAYLDPWSLIFIALALEVVLTDRGQYAYLKACLLLGVASVFKEPAVFLIPWLWLAGRPWSRGIEHFKNAVLIGFASVLPFIVYYLIRREFGVSRYDYIGFDYFLTEPWFTEMGHRLTFHLGLGGVVLLIVLGLFWLYCLFKKELAERRPTLICLIGAGMTLLMMFNLDVSGKTFTGYFRFYLPIFLLLVSPLLLIQSDGLGKMQKRKWIYLLSILIMVAHGPKLLGYLSLTSDSDAARNFTEHYDAPIFLPIRSLVNEAEKSGVLKPGVSDFIHINHITGWNQPDYGYPDIEQKYDLRVEKETICQCSLDRKVVIAPFIYYTGLSRRLIAPDFNGLPQLGNPYIKRWSLIHSIKNQCLESLRETCGFYAEEKIDGEVIGAIGILR